MAQFKRNLFNTSYFGKSYSFVGEYNSRIINVGEPFTGFVDVSLKIKLPVISHYPKDGDFYTINNNWKINTAGTTLTSNSDVALPLFFCADIITIVFDTTSTGNVLIRTKDDTGKIIDTNTIDTNTVKSYKIELPYGNKWIDLKPVTSTDVIVLKQANARVSSVRGEVLTNKTYVSQDPSTLVNVVPIVFPSILKPDGNGFIYGKSSVSVTNQSAIGVKLYLTSSDDRQISSPEVDTIKISSGDISRYTKKGSWQASLNMNNIADNEGLVFKRTKRLDFVVNAPSAYTSNDINWMDKYLEIKTTSKDLTIVGDKTNVTDSELVNPSFWGPETASYRKYNNVVSPRIALRNNKVGDSTENKEYGTVLFGPFSKESMPYINTKLKQWSSLQLAYSLPTNTNNTYFNIQVYTTKDTVNTLPIFEKTISGYESSPIIPIELTTLYEEIYIGITFNSTTKTQTPVIDSLNLNYELEYNKIINYNSEISPMDNSRDSIQYPQLPEGTKLMGTINTSTFGVPSVALNKKYTVNFKPLYPSQQIIYFGDINGNSISDTNKVNHQPVLYVFSRVTAKTPTASTLEVPNNELYWHYQYDGGSVSLPFTNEKELSTQFTPSLKQNKTYRFYIRKGWPSESFNVPVNMTWSEIAEIVGESETELKQINKNIVTYNNKVQGNTVIELPNGTVNPNVKLSFTSTPNALSSKISTWNKNTKNDRVKAEVIGTNQEVVEWKSEERIFAGIINPNNIQGNYVRTQTLLSNSESNSQLVKYTGTSPISYLDISKTKKINLADLLLVNNLLDEYGNANNQFVQPGENYLVPAKPSLPNIPSNVFYEGTNPYYIEVIPNTIVKSFDGVIIDDSYLISGSDDEPGVQYQTTESEEKQHVLTRGSVLNGIDVLPYSNVSKINSITNNTTGVTYTKYLKSGTTETGDYYLENGMINWGPRQAGSKEPAPGDTYTVKFTNKIVNQVKIIYTTNYKEKLSYNKLWRSKEIKEYSAVVTPKQDAYLDLPEPSTFSDYYTGLTNIDYVIQDSDLWVKNTIEETPNGKKVRLSLEGKDPKRNWFPTINKGFYYLNDQEHYMYSEPIKYTFNEDVVPIIEKVTYNKTGLNMIPTTKVEYISNYNFDKELTGYTTTGNINLASDIKEGNYVSLEKFDDNIVPSISLTIPVYKAYSLIKLRLRSSNTGNTTITFNNKVETIALIPNEWTTYEVLLSETEVLSQALKISTDKQLDISIISLFQ